MKLSIKSLFLIAGLLTIVYSCDKEVIEDPFTCNTDNVTYDARASAFLNESCALSGCHLTGDNLPTLDNYEDAAAASLLPSFLGAINHQDGFKPMPYPEGSSKLDDCTIMILTAWVEDGSPQ